MTRLATWDAALDWLAYDQAVTRSYGHLAAHARAAGKTRLARSTDIHIAAVAHANGAGVLTWNMADFECVEKLVRNEYPDTRK